MNENARKQEQEDQGLPVEPHPPTVEEVAKLYGKWMAAHVALGKATEAGDDAAAFAARDALCAAYDKWQLVEKDLVLCISIGLERWRQRKASQ